MAAFFTRYKYQYIFINIFAVYFCVISSENIINNNILPNNILDDDKPDIYHILFDAYTGLYGLKHLDNFDNSDFYNKLNYLEFETVKGVYTNYNHTSAFLASMTNIAYIKGYLSESDFNNKIFIADNQYYRFSFVLNSKVVYALKK